MPAPKISKEELGRWRKTIEECLQDGFTPKGMGGGRGSAIEEAARRLGLTPGSIAHQIRTGALKPNWKKYRRFERLPATIAAVEADERRQIQALTDRIKLLEAQLREADRAHTTEEEVRKRIFKLAEVTPDPPAWLVKPTGSAHGITGVPSTIWSDWHLGERVSLAETNGYNAFDLEIARARIRRLVEGIIDLCYKHMTNPKYPGIVVNLLGDIISGQIHPELAETDEDDIFPTILWALDIIAWAIGVLADHFSRVHVFCSPGNHGRVFDRKPRAKRYVYRNGDWLLYCLLERHFRNDKRVTFSIPATGENLYRIYDFRYMAVHGDDLGVKGGDGIIGVLGPIARGEIKMRHSSAQIGRDYDMLLMGHWHQTLWLPRCTVNNTLKGFDEYARRMLRASPTPPAQCLWFTHPDRGITCRWEVFLNEKEKKPPMEWLAVPASELTMQP